MEFELQNRNEVWQKDSRMDKQVKNNMSPKKNINKESPNLSKPW